MVVVWFRISLGRYVRCVCVVCRQSAEREKRDIIMYVLSCHIGDEMHQRREKVCVYMYEIESSWFL